MKTLYVPLSEIEKLWRLKHTQELMVTDKDGQYVQLSNIYYLQTIDLSVIDEMIEENKDEVYRNPKNLLQELKARLSPKK